VGTAELGPAAVVIRRCDDRELDPILAVINDAAQAYRGVIPEDRLRQPYMAREELRHEIDEGVQFWGYEDDRELIGVMGLQEVEDVILIRHAYVRTAHRRRGIGSRLLAHLRGCVERPLLVGTWADAAWAVRFYRKHGFDRVPREQAAALLRRYWSIPERQIEISVVLAESEWLRNIST
jgi:GNAT superfamily N-acetyltransferase